MREPVAQPRQPAPELQRHEHGLVPRQLRAFRVRDTGAFALGLAPGTSTLPAPLGEGELTLDALLVLHAEHGPSLARSVRGNLWFLSPSLDSAMTRLPHHPARAWGFELAGQTGAPRETERRGMRQQAGR